jgi:excisionase family DNA binding protein
METKTRKVERLAFSIGEAAAAISCSPGHIRNLIERGELQSAKVGRRRVVRAASLEALLDRGDQDDQRREAA